ncbi:MAG TPA: hypothetical protein PK990_02960 [Salinivirgaceae bacterium]|nr:hypothetical protein [Salinivirgaceae bacterium]
MKNIDTTIRLKNILRLIVFIAGFAFISYEINLFRSLSNLFGATIVASTLTLSIFMAGYGIGAYSFGHAFKTHYPIRTLIVLMMGLSLSGLAAYSFIQWGIPKLYFELDSADSSFFLQKFASYAMASVFLLLPSFFMGGILPIITQIFQSWQNKVINSISTLYALDTLGGVLGGVFTTFFLNKFLGQIETVIIISITVLCPILFLLPFLGDFSEENPNNANIPKRIPFPAIKRYLLTTALLGFTMNAFQILLIRVFKIFLINTIYTFTLITAMVILGLFLGSYLIKIRQKYVNIHKIKLLLLIMGSSILIVALAAKHIPTLLMFPLSSLFPSEIFRAFFLPAIILTITILPIAALSGYMFPALVGLADGNDTPHGKLVAIMLAANTIGSVIGPLIAAFVFIPFLGIGRSLILISIFPIILIPYLKSTAEKSQKSFISKFAFAAIVVVAILFVVTSDYKIVPPSFIKNKTQILAYRETLEGNYSVGEEQTDGGRILSTYVNNSAVIGTTYDAIKVVKMVGHLPFLFDLKAEKALVVGFGIGVTTAAIASHPEIQQIDCIELVKDLTQVAHFYSDINNNIHLDKRLRFYQDDGRHFLQQTSQKYDLISSDPTHPILGSGNLYTKEYWELCKKKLSPHGMISQYLPIHKLTLNDFLGIVKTFHHVFPNSALFVGHFHAVLIGSMKNLSFDFNHWEKNALKTSSDRLFYNNPYHLAASLMLDSSAIAKLCADKKINTDNHTWTDYFDFDALREENLWKNLQFLNQNRSNIEKIFTNVPDTIVLRRFFKGNFYLTEGLVELHRGNKHGLFQYLEKAAMVNPENVEYPLLLRFYENRKNQ